MGRGGVVSKGHKGACYWVWYLCKKIVECLKKDPSCFRKWPEPCFLRPDLKIFLEFSKKKFFATCVSLNMTRQNYFFVKKVCKKSLPIKFVVDFFSNKKGTGVNATEYEIYVTKYFLVWKKTHAASGNIRNNVL